MACIPRILLNKQGESTVYHVMSRTALDVFPMKDVEKDFLLELLKRLSGLYFVEVLGFCWMDNHFHLLIRMHSDSGFTDGDIKERFERFHDRATDGILLPTICRLATRMNSYPLISDLKYLVFQIQMSG